MSVMRATALAMFLTILLAVPALAQQSACQYQTDWGVATLRFEYRAGAMTGDYPHQNGQLMGVIQGETVQGTWRQANGQGNFFFRFNANGFTGNWNYATDTAWRGQWNGKLLKCW